VHSDLCCSKGEGQAVELSGGWGGEAAWGLEKKREGTKAV